MGPTPTSRVRALFLPLSSGLLLLGTAAAAGSFVTGFEAPDYEGSADGVPVAGQQGWYVPTVEGAVDQYVFTYDGNALGLPANPFGEDQFLGAQTPEGLAMFPRAQLDFDWSAGTVWTVSYDIAVAFNGTLPAQDFISSFSLQDSTIARSFTAVSSWVNPDTASQWNANYIAYFADGTPFDQPGASPGAAWRDLQVGHWYNQSTTFDFDSNRILSVSITDLDTGDTATFEPANWYLQGGASPANPLPTALRFFVGGGGPDVSTPGNVGGFDNLNIDLVGGASAPNRAVYQNVQRVELKGLVAN